MKPCPGCGKGPDETEFYASARKSHTTRCKPCWRAFQRARYVPKMRVPRGSNPNPKPKHSTDAATMLAGLMGAKL